MTDDTLEGFEELTRLVAAIRRREPVQLSPEVEALIRQAAPGAPADIRAWARRLAEDVGDLTD